MSGGRKVIGKDGALKAHHNIQPGDKPDAAKIEAAHGYPLGGKAKMEKRLADQAAAEASAKAKKTEEKAK